MRRLRQLKREIEFSRTVFNFETTLSDIDETKCYFSEKTGAFMLYMYGHLFHEDEITVAKAFADNGFLVVLTPENNKIFATNKVVKNGNVIYKFSEGWVNGRTFEQRTIEESGSGQYHRSISKAIEHARVKNSDIAVIFDKNGLLQDDDITNGIIEYESHKANVYRLKQIIVFGEGMKMSMWNHIK